MSHLVIFLALLGQIELKSRVSNNECGVCWFACADSILGTTMVDGVMETGIGKVGGAGDDDIDYWCNAFDVDYAVCLTVKGVEQCIGRGIPVIATVTAPGNATHAIVVLDVKSYYHRRHYYKTVTIYDPNCSDRLQKWSWSTFTSRFWRGHCFRTAE